MMKTITITLNDQITEALELYTQTQLPESTPIDHILNLALEQFLQTRGYLAQRPKPPLRLVPAPQPSGYTDTSLNHDAVLAEIAHSNHESLYSS